MFFQCSFKLCLVALAHLIKGQTAGTDVHTHHVHSLFYGDGVDVAEKVVAKVKILKLHLGALLYIAVAACDCHVVSGFRRLREPR